MLTTRLLFTVASPRRGLSRRALALALGAAGWLGAAPFEARAQAMEDKLPPLLRAEGSFPVYGPANDVLKQGITVEGADDGDEYLLKLARAGDINLIASVPEAKLPVPRAEAQVNGQLHMRLAEVDRDCGLTWHRLSERTILMWPQPDEAKLGLSWLEALEKQALAPGSLPSTVTTDNLNAALGQLNLPPTEDNRSRMREDYVDFEQEQTARDLGASVRKYLQASERTVREGESLLWRDLPQDVQAQVQHVLRGDLEQGWSPAYTVWFVPEQREKFLSSARLSVGDPSPVGGSGQRALLLKGQDLAGRPLRVVVSTYDPHIIPPDNVPISRSRPAPRPERGISIEGTRLPLAQVLEKAGKQSKLDIQAPIERLRQSKLTLSVRGMSSREFLQALARTFLIEWSIDGKKATAREAPCSEVDRFYLSLGDSYQYRLLSRRARDDRQEEFELARSLYEEVGDDLFKPEGVALTSLSQEARAGVRGEGQETSFDVLLGWAPRIVPAALGDAVLRIVRTEPALRRLPGGTILTRIGGAPTLAGQPEPVSLSLLLTQGSKQPIVLCSMEEPTPAAAGAAPEDGQAQVLPTEAAARLATVYSQAQASRDRRMQQIKDASLQQMQALQPEGRP